MNKQMKTLNKKKKKLNTNFPKLTSLPTRTITKPYLTKVSNLYPPTKQATIRNTKPISFSQTTKNLNFGQCSYQNATKPPQNSTLLYHHNLLILL